MTAPPKAPPRCYTLRQVLSILQLPRRTFNKLWAAHELPMVEELRPRLGRTIRFRADLIDRYVAGEWGQSRYLSSHKRLQHRPTTEASGL